MRVKSVLQKFSLIFFGASAWYLVFPEGRFGILNAVVGLLFFAASLVAAFIERPPAGLTDPAAHRQE